MSIITTEHLTKILSETQAVITECNSRSVHGSVEVNARLFENVLMELLRHRAAMLHGADGNSPVVPDGWVMVPVEPTEDMIVNGFESEPDESFSDAEVWEAYNAMSGCQQAAHRAKLCWAAMIAAAPKPEA
ncbi:hypothetical protein [Klebsiella pneumoniae]|uniref:hypothetical protein n=1 Tax=Klebsiella pneumoniae TaxID=573 RepID=UPI002118C537|nr:hypothetical protein [Klebsiella pneumoniae]MCO0474587.1 hypothetical protein [Escherichia coli]MCV1082573.1 hypothetical protein [Escherichia coli]